MPVVVLITWFFSNVSTYTLGHIVRMTSCVVSNKKWNYFQLLVSFIAYLSLHFSPLLLVSASNHAVFLNFLAVSSSLIRSRAVSWVKKRAGSISVIHGMDRGWVLLQVDKKISSFCCCLHALCTLSLICDVLLWIDVQLRPCNSVALRKGVKYK